MTSGSGDESINDQANSVGSTGSNGNLRDRQHVDNYDATNPGKDDAVFYEGTWWRYVCGTGWVEQEFEQGTQRIRDKGLPVGPSDSSNVKGFGQSVTLVEKRFEIRGWAGDVYQRGVSYGPNDNQKAVYKIDWSGVVAFWNTGENVWYAVKWNKKDQKFTKADNIAPEGIPLKPEHTARKWQDDIKVSNVEVDQEFYDGNTWWVKQNGQLVEQEWNPRNDQFRPKNSGLRGPCGKLVVGRFGKEMDIKELTGVNAYQDMHTGEVYMAVPDRAYVDAKTDVVYYHATNGVGQKWWWYAKWDGGIGKFNASWSISYGPTSETVLEWVPSTDGPFDVDDAKENQIVWYNNSFWKKMYGVWVEHTWDEKNSKIVINKETTSPPGALIAPVGDVLVNLLEDVMVSRSAVQDKGNASKGAYYVAGDSHIGMVFWWDGKTWSVARWTTTGEFSAGSKKEHPIGLLKKMKSVMKLSAVVDGNELWYRGAVWKKKDKELLLVHFRGNNSQSGTNRVKKVPIGPGVKVERATCRW